MSSASVALPVVGSVKLMHIALLLGAVAIAYWYVKVYKKSPGKEVVPVPPPGSAAAVVVSGNEMLLPFKQFNQVGQAQQPIILFEQSRQAKDILSAASNLIVKRVHIGMINGSSSKILSAVPMSALKVGNGRVVSENMTVEPWELNAIQMDRNALNNLMSGPDPAMDAAANGGSAMAASASSPWGKGELALYVVASVM